jgi:hypothetical protein
LLSAKLTDENSETKGSFSSKVSNGFHAVTSFISRHKVAAIGIAGVCIAVGVGVAILHYMLAPAAPAAFVVPGAPKGFVPVVSLSYAAAERELAVNARHPGYRAGGHRAHNV